MQMETDLTSNVLNFLKEEKIKMRFQKVSNSEFWLEAPCGFLTTKFYIDENNNEVSYDLFSPKYDVHFKEKDLQDVEKLDAILEEKGKWDYERSIEGLWLILDCIKLWAQKNKFNVREKHLV
jgi:hypothetical protein